jgi:twitching motility protein PilT
MRDLETIDTAIKAAETGHLVFSTLHTTDATKTITRIIDQFPPHQHMQVRYQLAANLKAIISQRLLVQKNSDMMVPAVEILVATVTIQQQIIDPQKTIAIRDTISRGRSQYQMQTLDQHLTDLYNDDLITLETALTAATNPSDFQRALQFE